jgi:hypothetical protein
MLLSIIALGLLSSGFLLIIGAFYHAACDGMIPLTWGEHDGNHGPWRHYLAGRTFLSDATNLQFCAGLAALIALITRPRRPMVILFTACLLSIFLAAYYLYWLID